MYRQQNLAPASRVSEERRGRERGRFCKVCCAVYPLHSARHAGKPMFGRDHVASPCSHEGDRFEHGDAWWEPAVVVKPRKGRSES